MGSSPTARTLRVWYNGYCDCLPSNKCQFDSGYAHMEKVTIQDIDEAIKIVYEEYKKKQTEEILNTINALLDKRLELTHANKI